MNTNLFKENSVIQGLSRLSKVIVVAGAAALMTLTQADARDHHRRDDHRRDYHRRDYDERRYYHPAPVRRGWSRPGFYGAYPPYGSVDYRYIRALPRGYRTVYRDGHRYYYANGSYYWPARYNNSGVYISVRF